MPQSEMEALLQLQKETIESLRQLVESQRLTIEQMAKSHEEQTAQLNQTIANLNETVEYLKKKLFSSSSAFCGAQRTSMRFRADAVQSITDALNHLLLWINSWAGSLQYSA